jgi:hypothetical protein
VKEYGIWSDAAGGFIDGPLYTLGEAQKSLAEYLAEGEHDAEILEWFDETDEDEEEA